MSLAWPSEAPSAGSVLLRPLSANDAHLVAELAADSYIPTIGSVPAQVDGDGAAAWISRQLSRAKRGTGYSFAVADRHTDRAVGNAGLSLRALDSGRAVGGYAISPQCRGRGYATDALVALTAFAWTVPGLHRIELYIEPWNVASIRTAERAGYLREGLLRSHQEINGVRRDMVLYAALPPRAPADQGALRRNPPASG
ncbi:GNAT family N-acetyltransferase [Ruania alba]|uniref:Protein N-acetyltransferase, RimJ/RimL family n=1 Tax=Ruania alba TaxID=648782 RepID=A0A1H5DMV9_9MICO|nr:GNAT family protein [Ruania alba]SED80203.1 Protein N-acetyltransferase, RimJ/RimL family [Ruania alba]